MPFSRALNAARNLEEIRMFFAKSLPVCVICCLAIGMGCLSVARGQEPAGKNQPTSFWMQKKLEYSKNILGGIATADFDVIVKNGEAMRRLSAIEGLMRRQAPGYNKQLQLFEDAADEIIRQGNKDNVDGVALAFTQLTISCVSCHKQLREQK